MHLFAVRGRVMTKTVMARLGVPCTNDFRLISGVSGAKRLTHLCPPWDADPFLLPSTVAKPMDAVILRHCVVVHPFMGSTVLCKPEPSRNAFQSRCHPEATGPRGGRRSREHPFRAVSMWISACDPPAFNTVDCNRPIPTRSVVPLFSSRLLLAWIPACAGMTGGGM